MTEGSLVSQSNQDYWLAYIVDIFAFGLGTGNYRPFPSPLSSVVRLKHEPYVGHVGVWATKFIFHHSRPLALPLAPIFADLADSPNSNYALFDFL